MLQSHLSQNNSVVYGVDFQPQGSLVVEGLPVETVGLGTIHHY
jgi:hypothetical protein